MKSVSVVSLETGKSKSRNQMRIEKCFKVREGRRDGINIGFFGPNIC